MSKQTDLLNLTDAITVDSSNNVGIGTSSPSATLTASQSGNNIFALERTGVSGSGQFGINVETNSQTTVSYDDGAQLVFGTASSPSTHSGFAERLRIDSSGRVTMPYQPAFAYTGTNYNQGAGASIIIPASTKLNTGGHYNGSTGVFTAPVSGFYIFGFFGLSYPHNSEVNQIGYFKNGVLSSGYMQFAGNASIHQIASGGYGVYLNANDTLDLRYYRSSGSAYAYASQWTMWGYLIG